MHCLICQKELLYPITLRTLLWGKYIPRALCERCLNQADCLDICHQHFLVERDYRYYLAFSTYYEQQLKNYKRFTFVTHPPFYQHQLLADYTYRIVAHHMKKVVSIQSLPQPLTLPILLVDYNGISEELIKKLTIQAPKIERLTLWRKEYGDIHI